MQTIIKSLADGVRSYVWLGQYKWHRYCEYIYTWVQPDRVRAYTEASKAEQCRFKLQSVGVYV